MKYVVYFAIGWCVLLAVAGEAMAYGGELLLENCKLHLLGVPTINESNTTDDTRQIMRAASCIGYMRGVMDTNFKCPCSS